MALGEATPLTARGRRVRAVLFDLDDTLLDWSGQTAGLLEIERPRLQKIYNYLCGQGHSLPDLDTFCTCYRDIVVEAWQEAKKTWSGVSFANILSALFAALALDEGRIDVQAVMQAYDYGSLERVVLFAEAPAVLEKLRQRGYALGLITNSMLPMWMRDIELAEHGILDFFDVRLTSGDVGYMKPHPAIYQRALELLDVAAAHAVFVGDRPANDIAGANDAGLISVLFAAEHLDRPLNEVVPDYIIDNLSDLLSILERLEGIPEQGHE